MKSTFDRSKGHFVFLRGHREIWKNGDVISIIHQFTQCAGSTQDLLLILEV